ncbi:C40 family peptidase [Longivirga aurantiaca]|uniref:NlpC/P60 family protein n=1 Tax=Longivirga aurantiaca TaxID=1837743 RepID=A0ABW1T254_9ACTN
MATSTTALVRVRGTRAARIAAPVAAFALLVSGVALASAPASAQPTKTIEQVQAEIDALEADAANAAEAWNEARTRQNQIDAQIAKLTTRIAVAKKTYEKTAAGVDAIARAAYASGGMEPSLQALLADDPEQFLEQSAALDQVARSQGTSLRRTQAARLALAQLEAQLVQKQEKADAAAAEAKAAKATVTERLDKAQRILAGLKAEERARLARLQEARRQASARAAARATAQIRASRDTPRQESTSTSGTSSSSNDGGSDAPNYASGRARIAVAYALAQVGKRYVAAASGPNAFDCSGLTLAAWAQAGAYLPHYSKAQWSATARVSRGELRPGDLVFYFGGGAHHVGMYVGGGMMVSASNPRDGVELIGVWSPWYGERYSGAGRVV